MTTGGRAFGRACRQSRRRGATCGRGGGADVVLGESAFDAVLEVAAEDGGAGQGQAERGEQQVLDAQVGCGEERDAAARGQYTEEDGEEEDEEDAGDEGRHGERRGGEGPYGPPYPAVAGGGAEDAEGGAEDDDEQQGSEGEFGGGAEPVGDEVGGLPADRVGRSEVSGEEVADPLEVLGVQGCVEPEAGADGRLGLGTRVRAREDGRGVAGDEPQEGEGDEGGDEEDEEGGGESPQQVAAHLSPPGRRRRG